MKNYKKNKKDIKYCEIIKEIHMKLEKCDNIEFSHVYSHLNYEDDMTKGNRKAD